MTATAIERQRPAARIDLSRTFIRRTNMSYANLVGADFSFADCANALFVGADLKDAVFEGTVLKGANFSGAKNLTRQQLQRAILDSSTILPEGLK